MCLEMLAYLEHVQLHTQSITANLESKQGLIASKPRLSKKKMTIPRLELVVAQMVVNLAHL